MNPPYNRRLSLKTVLKRIDAILRKLHELRQAVVARNRPTEKSLTSQLYGALGQGSWDEYNLLNRTSTPPVAEIVAQAPEGEPLSLDEINDIVHELRRQRTAQ